VLSPHAGFLRKLRFNCRMLGRRIRAELRDEWPRLKPRLWWVLPPLLFSQPVHPAHGQLAATCCFCQ
jgi:hypothetical protein